MPILFSCKNYRRRIQQNKGERKQLLKSNKDIKPMVKIVQDDNIRTMGNNEFDKSMGKMIFTFDYECFIKVSQN